MNGKDFAMIAAGVGILWLISKLFRDAEERDENVWEISTPDPFGRAVSEGIITPKQIADLAKSDSAQFIGQAVAQLAAAPGVFSDDEALAVSSAKMRTYPEQLAFGSTFYTVQHKTVEDFLKEFMLYSVLGDEGVGDVKRHVLSLRP